VRRRTSCRSSIHLALLALAVQAVPAGAWQDKVSDAPELDAGFRLLYELKPGEARGMFALWQASHPLDPLGSASEAVSCLFEEFYRQDILTSEYFLDDKRFLGKVAISRTRICAISFSLRTSARKTWHGVD
jgi:hypothetical protein